MSPLLRKRAIAKPHSMLLVDIGSGSVGAALVEIAPGERPLVRAHKRFALKLAPGRSAAQLLQKTRTALSEVLAALEPSLRRYTLHHIAVFLPAPWSALELAKIRFSQSSAFLADDKLVNRLIGEHVRSESRVAVPESSIAGSPEVVFERTVAGVRLNGYASPALSSERAVLAIELTLASSRAPRDFIDELRRTINASFGNMTISLHGSNIAAAHALCALAANETFLLCDGEGELAELLLVRETIPEAHATIPVGFATLLRTLALHGGFAPEELPSALALLGNPSSPLAVDVREAALLAKKECAEALGNAAPLCETCMPSVAYLIGEGEEVRWFGTALSSSPRLTSVLPKDFRVEIVTGRALGGQVALPPGKRGDPMLMLEALYAADRFANPHTQEFYR